MTLKELRKQFDEEYKVSGPMDHSTFLMWLAYKKCASLNGILSEDIY